MRPHHEEGPKAIIDISEVIDFALAYNPFLAAADMSTIRMWTNAGCDVKMDILPAMKEVMKRKKDAKSFKYFTNPVLAARDSRLAKAQQAKEAVTQPDAYYAKIFMWKRSKGMILSSDQEALLARYESSLANRLQRAYKNCTPHSDKLPGDGN